ncbi:thioredoxin-like domain-containing protein [Limnoglobus roseus]|uniref:TlpA-like protein n=1 Tax=Limnoglobus roseus TaxID=2598579 RepID=A0A5C1AKG0_9BACT|nr:thioredoxin-like domain-containing protein [Limnoglobus roseus]QEL18202.1 TlpA-like protein [Limnoglobus roseus]
MTPPAVPSHSRFRWLLAATFAFASLAVVAAVIFLRPGPAGAQTETRRVKLPDNRPDAPELTGGVAWLNTSGPVKKSDLKGKVVLLDFWTLCCINCIHIMPDLAKLEKKYPNELVVIGVHSAKFENEKDTKSIRKAVLRYEIAHPVVNDANHAIWDNYDVSSWPTMAVIDAEGKFVGTLSGEGNYDVLDKIVSELIAEAKEKKVLNEKPIRFDLARFRETGDTPLFFPGKVFADEKGGRLFIADSTHHRIVVTDLDGTKKEIIGGGTPGYRDGSFTDVRFDDPQGMALDGETLYVADRKNHSIRALDLKAKTAMTVAGIGKQDGEFASRRLDAFVDAKSMGLNSPWDVLIVGRQMFIAMAGHHQIWVMDLDAKKIKPFAGNGRENIVDGPLYAASFAQPSGLTSDGQFLYVADSEGSAVRKLAINGEGTVSTFVGRPGDRGALFFFGDQDGKLAAAKLQHALAVQSYAGKLLVADTYNSKLKEIDPTAGTCTTILGGEEADSFFSGPVLSEPTGLSIAAGKLYIADTNAHRIRVVDLKTKQISTLALKGVEPPPPQKEWQPVGMKK